MHPNHNLLIRKRVILNLNNCKNTMYTKSKKKFCLLLNTEKTPTWFASCVNINSWLFSDDMNTHNCALDTAACTGSQLHALSHKRENLCLNARICLSVKEIDLFLLLQLVLEDPLFLAKSQNPIA